MFVAFIGLCSPPQRRKKTADRCAQSGTDPRHSRSLADAGKKQVTASKISCSFDRQANAFQGSLKTTLN